jgi:hypothetical protein
MIGLANRHFTGHHEVMNRSEGEIFFEEDESVEVIQSLIDANARPVVTEPRSSVPAWLEARSPSLEG